MHAYRHGSATTKICHNSHVYTTLIVPSALTFLTFSAGMLMTTGECQVEFNLMKCFYTIHIWESGRSTLSFIEGKQIANNKCLGI